jgi:hypothetical protein
MQRHVSVLVQRYSRRVLRLTLSALLRENKLRDQTSVSQTAPKVMNLQEKVVTLYYRRPSCFFLSQVALR